MKLLTAVPLMVVAMVLATLRLPLMVPPVHANFPAPVKLPGPKNFPFPVSAIVLPGPMDTGEARLIAALCSNCRVPPPLRVLPALSSPGPPITSSTLPRPTDAAPWSLKSRKPTVALPDFDAGTRSVPVLTSTSGVVQQEFACTVAPGCTVKVPELLISAPKVSSGPESCTVVVP